MDLNYVIYLSIVIRLFAVGGVQGVCKDDEKEYKCPLKPEVSICYGGSSGMDADDVLCWLEWNCDSTWQSDTCGNCDQNPSQYPGGSRYKDCAGNCFDSYDDKTMKTLDKCGVCDGDEGTCYPEVLTSSLTFGASSYNLTFDIGGVGFRTLNIEIVILQVTRGNSGNPIERPRRDATGQSPGGAGESRRTGTSTDALPKHRRRRAENKIVQKEATIVHIEDATNMTITVPPLEPGRYEIGARVGPDGEDYNNVTGPEIRIYDPSVFSTDGISPRDLNYIGLVSLSVSLTIVDESTTISVQDIYVVAPKVYCFTADTANSDISAATETVVVDDYSNKTGLWNCTITVPGESKAMWVCATLDRLHTIGCEAVHFYEQAPAVIDNEAIFSAMGDSLKIAFNKRVENSPADGCDAYFDDTSAFGGPAVCRFNAEATELTVMFGDGSTILPGMTIDLKDGLQPEEGQFKRSTPNITLSLVSRQGEDVPNAIQIAKRGFWPTTLTLEAQGNVTLEIVIVFAPGDRQPASVVWMLNGAVVEAVADEMEMTVNITSGNEFLVTVTAKDFLNGTAFISHTIRKVDIALPNVILKPAGVLFLPSGGIQIYPNTAFGIGTRIEYTSTDGSGLDAFRFRWRRDGIIVPGEYRHIAKKSDITINMCGDEVVYSLEVALIEDTSVKVAYEIPFIVGCRNPIPIIKGGSTNAISADSSSSLTLYGSLSYDPDGGLLSYQWSCLTDTSQNCINNIDIVGATNTSTLAFNPKKMKGGVTYTFTLMVSVEKKDKNYSSSKSVVYIVHGSSAPTIRMVTIRHNFRHDRPIMIKAEVSKDVAVAWRFVPNLWDYDWLNADLPAVGRASNLTTDWFTWYTIQPGALTPGRKYKMEVKAINAGDEVETTHEHVVNVYQTLRGCTISARDITELTETSLSLRNCVHDPEVTWLDTICTVCSKPVPTRSDLTFIVPVFSDRSTATTHFKCTIRDSLGHSLSVTSNTVNVNMQADVNQHTQDIVEELEQQDDLLNAIEIMAASPPTKSDLQHSLQTRAVGHIERLLTKDPSPGDMRAIVNVVSRLNLGSIRKYEQGKLYKQLLEILRSLCAAATDSSAASLTQQEVQKVLQTAKDMSHLRGGKNPDYRKMDDLVTCINIRRMRNEDVSCFDTPDSSHCFLVNALDDVGEFLNVKFPEEMMETKYRDLWNCGVDQVCHGVGIKYEKYPTEPPDLLVRRSDTECATYTYLDLYNQLTGTRIPVKDLAGVIEITIGETACPRPECYFYDEFNKRFSTEGVITKLINKTLVCETNHLTGFTLRSKPPLYDGFNMPYVVTCVVVALVFAFAFVLLVRAFIILNSYPSKEEENDLAYFRESESPDLRVKT
ncbi:uncharacterized protein LOC128232391 [Mya arenaria]|uniref:uncharacterized protein LOC128232391 n=1 Tax=Mya arenaria TaxID=6604 RepID=UPI0022E5D80D|nr:uncharacterized protein LOC128232391 [Mya arenaria]